VSRPLSKKDLRNRFELKTVLETSRMLIESRSSEFVINNLLLIIMGKLLTTQAAILFIDPSTQRYTVKKARGLKHVNDGDVVDITVQESDKNRSHLFYTNFPDDIPELTGQMNGSVLIPLRTSSHHLGFLFIGPKANGEEYADHELEFAESLCIISSVALSNSILFDDLKATNRKLDRRVHELNTLFDLSKEFNLLNDRTKISNIFKFALLGQLFIRTFFMIYKTPSGPAVLASSGLNKEFSNQEVQTLYNLCPTEVKQVDQSCHHEVPSLKTNEISNIIGISIQGEKAAVIGVGDRLNKEPYTETDFNFLNSLANQAIVSIQKTFLFEERIEKERMEEELSIAKSIQIGLLPDPLPETEGIDLAAKTVSSREVGGDYFDIAKTPDGNSIFAIADVTGKGVPAALLMANLQSMLHVLLPVDITLSEATERINNLIFKNTPSDKFITFFWGKYLVQENLFRYVNAGHNPPLLLKKDASEFEELTHGGLLLGALETMTPYEQTDIPFNSGDLLVCYTDGVNEAMNSMGEEYGEERLKRLILQNRDQDSETILNAIVRDVESFSGSGKVLDDDLTLLVIRVY
jgi:phosphoserine phosphatase RsbU/P